MKESVPLLQWPKWITAKVGNLYLSKVYNEMQKRKRYQPIVDTTRLRKEAVAAHFFSAFKLDFAYFYSQ